MIPGLTLTNGHATHACYTHEHRLLCRTVGGPCATPHAIVQERNTHKTGAGIALAGWRGPQGEVAGLEAAAAAVVRPHAAALGLLGHAAHDRVQEVRHPATERVSMTPTTSPAPWI